MQVFTSISFSWQAYPDSKFPRRKHFVDRKQSQKQSSTTTGGVKRSGGQNGCMKNMACYLKFIASCALRFNWFASCSRGFISASAFGTILLPSDSNTIERHKRFTLAKFDAYVSHRIERGAKFRMWIFHEALLARSRSSGTVSSLSIYGATL